MKVNLIETHLLVPRSISSAMVRVKYEGHIFQKIAILEALVFNKHSLFLSSIYILTRIFIHLVALVFKPVDIFF